MNNRKRCGLTLVEIVVTVSLIAILIAILVPAIQTARESTRKIQCQNNLKQISLSVHAFHNANKSFPSPYGGTSKSYPLEVWDQFHMHSWRAALLPHMEQSVLHEKIDWQATATDRRNETVARTIVSSYICPSGSSPTSDQGKSAPSERNPSDRDPEDQYRVAWSDYDALAGAGAEQGILWGVWGEPRFRVNPFGNSQDSEELLLAHTMGRFKDISDGLSKTIMVVERGGRPLHMVQGLPKATSNNPNAWYAGQIAWSASNSITWRLLPGKFSINHDNQQSIYSNHVGGAYVALSDGSVTFLSESTDLKTISMMIGRNDGTN